MRSSLLLFFVALCSVSVLGQETSVDLSASESLSTTDSASYSETPVEENTSVKTRNRHVERLIAAFSSLLLHAKNIFGKSVAELKRLWEHEKLRKARGKLRSASHVAGQKISDGYKSAVNSFVGLKNKLTRTTTMKPDTEPTQ